jgi:hypothetical protein
MGIDIFGVDVENNDYDHSQSFSHDQVWMFDGALYEVCYLLDNSYYYSGAPYFVTESGYTFPSLGPYWDDLTQNIPARNRYDYTNRIYPHNLTLKPTLITVVVDQQKSNDSSFGSVFHWESYWEDYPVPHTFDDWGEGETHTLRANTTIIDGEKYHDWNENIYLNHNSFTVEAGFTEITAHFDKTDPVTIKTELISGGEGDSIELKDPWLTDYNESPYGMRNRGMGAPFKSKPSPLNLTLDSEYKGVFLYQGWPDWQPPYYSVGADDEQDITQLTTRT